MNDISSTRKSSSISFKGSKSLVKQSFRDQCNINKILGKFASTNIIEHVNPINPTYGDVSDVADFQAMQNARILAQNIYDSLPKEVRDTFSLEQLATGEFNAQYEDIIDNITKTSKSDETIPTTD